MYVSANEWTKTKKRKYENFLYVYCIWIAWAWVCVGVCVIEVRDASCYFFANVIIERDRRRNRLLYACIMYVEHSPFVYRKSWLCRWETRDIWVFFYFLFFIYFFSRRMFFDDNIVRCSKRGTKTSEIFRYISDKLFTYWRTSRYRVRKVKNVKHERESVRVRRRVGRFLWFESNKYLTTTDVLIRVRSGFETVLCAY